MAYALNSERILYENLIDAGLDQKLIAQCMKHAKEKQWNCCLAILKTKRKELLDAIHEEQERLDCLDYLVYRIRKEQEEER